MIKNIMRKSTKLGVLFILVALVLGMWVILSSDATASLFSDDKGFQYDGGGNTILSGLTTGDIASDGTVTIPNTVTTIRRGAFNGNSSVRKIIMPSSLTTIEESAFENCINLQNVDFTKSSNLRAIPRKAFANCTSLTTITTLPSSVTMIGEYAFENCNILSSVYIPPNVSSIDKTAFTGCTNLTSLNFNSGSSYYQFQNGCLYSNNYSKLELVLPYVGSSSADNLQISNNCSTIGANAFSINRYITSLTVPTTVQSIEANAFYGSQINSVTIPQNTRFIGTQNGWASNPAITIYGYADSAAENFAIAQDILFVVTGQTSNNNNSNPNYNNGYNNNYIPDNNNNNVVLDPNAQYPNNTVPNTNAGDTINNNNTNVTISGAGTGKDPTPKTADGDIDARWFLIAGFMLVGVSIMFYSRGRRFEYASRKKDSDLDS